jgi:hypothetical protein
MAAFFNRRAAPALRRVDALDRHPASAALACFWHADGAGALHRHWRPPPETQPAALTAAPKSRG